MGDAIERVECVVVGAGAIGLAVARRLALAGREIMVLERADAIGTESSSRSNEVMHAGLYYRPGGPQAVLCVAGKRALDAYCVEHGVPHERIGKLVVANGDVELAWLRETQARGLANGVPTLEWLDGEAARRLEPALRADAALYSPSTAIVDTHALMLAFQGEAEARGAVIALRSEVRAIRPGPSGFELEVGLADGGEMRLGANLVVNAAGIQATSLARRIEGLAAERVPRIHLAKGAYFALTCASPFRHLIVPTPEWHPTGGIYTLDLAHQGRFGPDVEWVDHVDYTIDASRVRHVHATVRRYWPELPEGALAPAYTGIRPRLNGPGEAMADWIIEGPAEHGLEGLVNLFGVESPGITASLAIAEAVAEMSKGTSFSTALGQVAQETKGETTT